MNEIPVFETPDDPSKKAVFESALKSFGPFPGRKGKVILGAKIHLARDYTLYGRVTGEFDDPSLDRMEKFEVLVEDELGIALDAQDIIGKIAVTIPVDASPFTIENLKDAYLSEVISGRPWNEESDQEFMRPLREFEANKLKNLASRTLLDLADPKIFSLEDIGKLDEIVDASPPGHGFATYLLLQPFAIVKVECALEDFLNACYSAINRT